jgi:integrase
LHDLIPLGPALPGALTAAEIDATMTYAAAEKALATRRAYLAGLARLRRPVHLQGRHSPASAPGDRPPPTSPASPTAGRKASTIGRRAAAIGYHHKMAGHEPPTDSEAVKAVLRGIRRTIGSAKQGKATATADLIGQMVALCPDNMIGKRDRALLCLGFAGAFRRSELCALEVGDLTEVPDGLPDPAQQGRSGRAGAGGGHSARLQAPPGRGRAGVAGSGRDQQP